LILQWFINETREKTSELEKKLDSAITGWAAGQIEAAEKIQKLEGEIRAMKARAGKNKE
jgi:hypothetical protein